MEMIISESFHRKELELAAATGMEDVLRRFEEECCASPFTIPRLRSPCPSLSSAIERSEARRRRCAETTKTASSSAITLQQIKKQLGVQTFKLIQLYNQPTVKPPTVSMKAPLSSTVCRDSETQTEAKEQFEIVASFQPEESPSKKLDVQHVARLYAELKIARAGIQNQEHMARTALLDLFSAKSRFWMRNASTISPARVGIPRRTLLQSSISPKRLRSPK